MAEPGGARRQAARRLPDLETPFTINEDGSRNFLHPADVRGRWQRVKNLVFAALIVVYLALPWIEIGGRPAVLLDIPGRRAFFFGATFTNEDVVLLFFVISGIGFGLILLTSLLGRVWCGFGCPQTVYLEGVFRKIERWIEGPRETRIRRNLGPPTLDKAWRKAAKHAAFVALCLGMSHAFLAYFIPARDLAALVRSSPSGHGTAFLWGWVTAAVLYLDFAWFREQTCLVVCPYGRLQSTLVDDSTIVIGYDARRGEPRSSGEDKGGDCIDCRRCVAVCPTGIDIRNGLQLECVGCANCIDACDAIMERIGKPRGLVRFDSQRGLEGGARRFLRPRVWLYAVLGLVGLAVFTAAVARREPFEARVLRTRGMPYVLEERAIRNLFNVRIQNKEAEPRAYRLAFVPEAGKPVPEILIAESEVTLPPFGDATVPVFVTFPRESYSEPFPLRFAVRDERSGRAIEVEATFLGP